MGSAHWDLRIGINALGSTHWDQRIGINALGSIVGSIHGLHTPGIHSLGSPGGWDPFRGVSLCDLLEESHWRWWFPAGIEPEADDRLVGDGGDGASGR